jgi:superoxide dismutase, Cu-Zn family
MSQRGIVARCRMAIAALAVSALFLAPSAAYAHDGHISAGTRVAASSVGSEMAWAYYRGELTDLSLNTDDVFDGVSATAAMIGIEGSTFFRLGITGIDKSAAGKEYPARLHEGPCEAGNAAAAGPHYNTNSMAGLPPVVSAETEVWLDFDVDSVGNARVTSNVPFVPLPAVRSIVIHDQLAAGASGLACLPLDIKSFPRTV